METIRIYPDKKTVISLAGEEVISLAGETVVIDDLPAQKGRASNDMLATARPSSSMDETTKPKV